VPDLAPADHAGPADPAAPARPAPRDPVELWAGRVLLGALLLVALLTALGLVRLWPDESQVVAATEAVPFAAPGVDLPRGTVTAVLDGALEIRVAEGAEQVERVVPVQPAVLDSGLQAGDEVQLLRIPQAQEGEPAYSLIGVDRDFPLGVLAVVFVVLTVAVARLRGLLALVGVGVGAFVVFRFMIPALLVGESGPLVALVGSAAIMMVVLYLAHGPSMRTSAALGGTLVSVGITAAIAWVGADASRLSGVGEEGSGVLAASVPGLDFHGLLVCGLIVAALGVLNDVTITQASSVWELSEAGPTSRWRVYRSAMRIGRDHIASTIYTIVFVYAGSGLTVLMLVYLYDRPLLDLLGTEDIAAELLSTLASAIGLVLAVPITTAIAALTAPVRATPATVTAVR
jgi:uncharacterized membrane protein